MKQRQRKWGEKEKKRNRSDVEKQHHRHNIIIIIIIIIPCHVNKRVQNVERVAKCVTAVLFRYTIRCQGHGLAATFLHAVFDHVMNQVHGPAHLAEHRVAILACLRAIWVPQARL